MSFDLSVAGMTLTLNLFLCASRSAKVSAVLVAKAIVGKTLGLLNCVLVAANASSSVSCRGNRAAVANNWHTPIWVRTSSRSSTEANISDTSSPIRIVTSLSCSLPQNSTFDKNSE
jgi:hypothetical protein